MAAVAVVSPSARGVASGTAAAALLLRLLGEGALRCYVFFLNKNAGFFLGLRLRSPPVASGRLRSTSLARRVSDGSGVDPGGPWVGLVWSVARSQLERAFM